MKNSNDTIGNRTRELPVFILCQQVLELKERWWLFSEKN